MASGSDETDPAGAESDDAAEPDAHPAASGDGAAESDGEPIASGDDPAEPGGVRPMREALDGVVTTRRAALATALAAAGGGVGWYTARSVTGRSPETVADRFYGALAEEAVGEANELLHPETPWSPVDGREAAAVADAGVFVAETAAHEVRGDESRSVVELTLRARDRTGGPRTRRIFASLRTDDGTWLLWDPQLAAVLEWLGA